MPKTSREIQHLSENYGCNFVMDWDDLREVAWPEGLSDDMKRFKPGRVIEFDDCDGRGKKCHFIRKILGLQWDDGDEAEALLPSIAFTCMTQGRGTSQRERMMKA